MIPPTEPEAHSLSRLCDITLPDPPEIWPMAPGFILLCIVLLTPLVALNVQKIQRYRKNAYRRAGLQILLEANSIDDLQIVLKRVALISFSRPIVAPLHGAEWIRFLHSTCPGVHFAELEKSSRTTAPISDKLRQQARHWIRFHKKEGGHA